MARNHLSTPKLARTRATSASPARSAGRARGLSGVALTIWHTTGRWPIAMRMTGSSRRSARTAGRTPVIVAQGSWPTGLQAAWPTSRLTSSTRPCSASTPVPIWTRRARPSTPTCSHRSSMRYGATTSVPRSARSRLPMRTSPTAAHAPRRPVAEFTGHGKGAAGLSGGLGQALQVRQPTRPSAQGAD